MAGVSFPSHPEKAISHLSMDTSDSTEVHRVRKSHSWRQERLKTARKLKTEKFNLNATASFSAIY